MSLGTTVRLPVATNSETRATLGTAILQAGRKLASAHGSSFTTQDLIKEAGVSLQTFYRYFPAGKDGLMLALIEAMIAEHCANLERLAEGVEDPVQRFELYIRATLGPLDTPEVLAGARFVTSEHWRLHQRFPREIWAATAPVTQLICDVLVAGRDRGQLAPNNPERDAWLITKTVLGAYHHHAFVPDDEGMDTLTDDVWRYCLAAVGGQPVTPRDARPARSPRRARRGHRAGPSPSG